MSKEIYDLYLKMGLSEKVLKMAEEAESGLKERFKKIDGIAEYNQLKVLHAIIAVSLYKSLYLSVHLTELCVI